MASQSDGAAEGNDESHAGRALRTPEPRDDQRTDENETTSTEGSKDNEQSEGSEEEEDEDEEEDEEPLLKYAVLTKGQGPIYRNGDAISAFLVAGDKMITGTHNGLIHVLSLPSFQSLRTFRAHSASVSSISISPFPPPLPTAKPEASNRTAAERPDGVSRANTNQSTSTSSPRGTRKQQQQPPVPNTPSNAIHVATSSIDGNVCVFSLVDQKDALVRNFGRPLNSVALSPDYKNDRSYLTGGLSGNLVLTVGGRTGASANANTSGAAATAAGWLSTIGIGGNNGTDTVLHSGEGIISTVKWSISGRYVVWVNEKGIKIMRSNLHLDSNESDSAWRRMAHIDRPTRPEWEELVGVWKARAEWIDEDGLETEEGSQVLPTRASTQGSDTPDKQSAASALHAAKKDTAIKKERLLVGWGDFIWIIDVHPGGTGVGKDAGERRIGRVVVVTKLRTDCIVSGVSLYTPNLLLVLAYVTPPSDSGSDNPASQGTPRGIRRRKNALQPEMRIIDVNTKEEVSVADTLTVSRFESLSATDYHLGVLPVLRGFSKTGSSSRAIEMITGVGASIWDATLYPTRLFSSAASIRSSSSGDRGTSSQLSATDTSSSIGTMKGPPPHPSLLTRGMKIFIQSPYDCVLATKPTLNDHLIWLDEHHKYEEAWKLLDTNPESAGVLSGRASGTSTPTTAPGGSAQLAHVQSSLAEFFADDFSQTTGSKELDKHSQASKDKRRIGEKWIQQLIHNEEWTKAGEVCGRVLDMPSSWERWVFVFAEANKYEEITPVIPDEPQRPPISSTVYEMVLGHYISKDPPKLQDLFERWHPELFDVGVIISALESKLNTGEIKETTVEDGETGRYWRILTDGLAKMYLAGGRMRDALKCYIKLQDADAAMSLITTQHLIDAVADDIPGLILLRVSKEQQKNASIEELDEASTEPIRLLVSEAHHGVVKPETVFKQLNAHKNMKAFQYFYLRDLWNGETMETADKPAPRRTRFDIYTNPLAVEGRSLVNDSADTALSLFAEYDRDLLFEFLKLSQSYTLSSATSLCEKRGFLPELVYLLANEGQTKRALRTIIDKMGDVSRAIAFAKEQDDPDLWNDLLNYSMNKPAFIRALLEEVGTAIDPIAVVRRIPEGLEIPGLRDALTRMIKEHELQHSISEGVVRVLRGEVTAGMNALRAGQKRAVRFDILLEAELPRSEQIKAAVGKDETTVTVTQRHISNKSKDMDLKRGYCAGCDEVLIEGEKDPLISFPCMHAFHLACFITFDAPPAEATSPQQDLGINIQPFPHDASATDPIKFTSFPPVESPIKDMDLDEFEDALEYGVGPKVDFAKRVKSTGKVKPGGGCPLEIHRLHKEQV